ncbi:MAG TPA: ABC transporter ATP-binding protein [Candidatus Binatia bacterium]|jgi:ABC-type multidrug transport system fused ATPase/permease subunit|nr:ABC transporter ATP-binding protein [Candidatus Binatia bacterium]
MEAQKDQLRFRLLLRLFRRCLPLLKPVRWHLVGLILGSAALAVVLLPLFLLLIDIIWTRVLQGQPLTEIEATLLRFDPALTVQVDKLSAELRRAIGARALWLFLVIAVPAFFCGFSLWYYQVWILQRINQTLRLALFDRLQALSLRFHAESRIGDAIYRLYQDSAMVTRLIEVLFLTPLFAGGRFVYSLAVVFALEPRLALLLALVWLPLLLVGFWASRRLRVGFRAAREANSALTSRIQENVAGIKVIKAYGVESFAQERFAHDSLVAFRRAYAARSLFAGFAMAIFWIVGVVSLGALGWATLKARDTATVFFVVWGFTVWNLGLYQYFRERLGVATNVLRDLFYTWGQIQNIAIGLDRVFELLDRKPEVEDTADAVAMPPFRSAIVFRSVSFAYQKDRPVLQDIDLEAPVGTITAIVGPTGAGKSTLMALLLRLFDPDAGSIEIDGRDIRSFTIDSLRAHIAIALQENVLFGTTVRENIRYAVPQTTDVQVRAAARVACAEAFIEALPRGYDTLLGERGTKLSTGQRQRLSLARALLKDTLILILDEPTASLDAETEMALLHNLKEWGKGRVIFLITHRLSTVSLADRIVYLREGQVVEAGTHAVLMAQDGGAYRRLIEGEELPASC